MGKNSTRAQAKSINLLLSDGTLDGLINIADSMWNTGELYSAPRNSVDDLIESEACKKAGVYLLISEDKVYVGQASDLSKRIRQHIIGKDWWERVIVLTTVDDNLNKSDIDYLEASLIAKAEKNNKLDCDNKNKGNKKKVDKFRKLVLEQYLDEALFLIELIGITVFKEDTGKRSAEDTLLYSIKKTSDEEKEIRAKSGAKALIKECGIELPKEFSYGKLQPKSDYYWLNPQTYLLQKEWYLVLNNQELNTLTVLKVPANTLHIAEKGEGLKVRNDKQYYIDLHIAAETLKDKRSKISFSPYVIKKINY